MKKVINGHRYDTDAAKEICGWDNCDGGWSGWGLNSISETLYRTKAGYYFIFGQGGANTKYAESIGQNQWRGGEQITPVSLDAAKEFAEQHADADIYEATFGTVAEPTAITVQLPDALLAELDSRKGKSRSEVVIAALKAYFAAEDK